mmetsp:Transcript_2151/g.6218  ORF Transcript_2151/g.6218 Transcript_2151/m.6218 type:complete len:240 (-) Transcript_2151:1154-1873(-)
MLISCNHFQGSKHGVHQGCAGGLPGNAFGAVHLRGGLSEVSEYGPFTSGNTSQSGACKCCGQGFGLCNSQRRECRRSVTCGGYVLVPDNDEGLLQDAVARQPVVAGVDAGHPNFACYQSGIFDDRSRRGSASEVNHAMLIVGYGVEAGVPYWKLKNSWGSSWGEGGYMRLRRGVRALGVGHSLTYPTPPTLPPRCAMSIEGDIRLTAYPKGFVTMYRRDHWRAICVSDKREIEATGERM